MNLKNAARSVPHTGRPLSRQAYQNWNGMIPAKRRGTGLTSGIQAAS
jgi:hypothetical protein